MDEKIIILWDGKGINDEWEIFEGGLDEAIAEVKRDHNWCNYSRKGAKIVRAKLLYVIREGYQEKRFE